MEQAGSSDRRTVVALTTDLSFATRFTDVVEAQGGRAAVAATPAAFLAVIDGEFPALAIVDLATPGDWGAAIQRSKLRPHTRHVPIYAFGSHVEEASLQMMLQAARAAGADEAWPRSRMMDELAAVIAHHLDPPVRYPAGWDDELSAKARAGLEEFNRGDYFEQHELLEEAWMEESRPVREMYQGILQVGLAFYQIERDNWAGALKMFRRGLPRLRDLPPVCQGVEVGALREAAEAIHAEVTARGPEGLATFDQQRFPRIAYRE